MDATDQLQRPDRNSPDATLRLLVDTGLRLSGERDLGKLTQMAADAAVKMTRARHGALIYIGIAEDGESTQQLCFSGAKPNPFSAPLLPQAAEIYPLHDLGADLCRYDDIHDDAAALKSTPFGLAKVHSFLGVPICSEDGEVLGRILLAHPQPGAFPASLEHPLHLLCRQVAFSIGNARVALNLSREIALTDHARRLQRETADRLSLALEAAKLGTWTWDRATDLLDLDERAAELFFAEPHTPLSRSMMRDRIVNPEDRATTFENLQASLNSGSLYNSEYRVEDPAGVASSRAFRWIAASGIPTYADDSGYPTGMIGTIQDITSRKTQEAALRQSEKLAATGRLAATIAHEINNPLEAVTNLIYLSRTDPDAPAGIQRLLETADDELARVSQIAQQTLGFYRDTTSPVEIDMNQLLTGVADLFARKMSYKRLSCSLDMEPGLKVFGLQGEIRQVFSNLMVNSIDAAGHSPSAGAIRIRARRCQQAGVEGVSVLVCDSGSGIPASIRSNLFSPFFTTKASVGTGLGLWVTRGIVEKQGGRISFRSRTQEPSGTIFRVFLPSKIDNPDLFLTPGSAIIQ